MWFYRYIIRGFGLVLIVGMLSLLALAIRSGLSRKSAQEFGHPGPSKSLAGGAPGPDAPRQP